MLAGAGRGCLMSAKRRTTSTPKSAKRTEGQLLYKECDRFHLSEPGEDPGSLEPDNLRVIQALHGVCYAIEELAEHGSEIAIQLGTAAEILSLMLQERIESD